MHGPTSRNTTTGVWWPESTTLSLLACCAYGVIGFTGKRERRGVVMLLLDQKATSNKAPHSQVGVVKILEELYLLFAGIGFPDDNGIKLNPLVRGTGTETFSVRFNVSASLVYYYQFIIL
ncbi:unnamed protein product [Microthlaspi erraticum]|uniref:Uncharacterized protein n=1 Tax=Microthlaspi erraticum TaxID=1685480 RepID=A0A6D2HS48_9BRAS|nr:unnamed protein product [Microthlaspi erraticum]